MEISKNIFYLLAFIAFIFLSTSAKDIQEQNPESTTEFFDIPSYETTTDAPNDNGMTIGDVPEEIKLNEPPSGVEGKEEEPSALEEQPVVVSFPDNHKNFTPSQLLGEQEFPPYYNHLNPYQQQYKNYFEQKQIYNRKPIKFEEDSLKNFYLLPQPNSLDVGDEKKLEDFRINRNPFPYVFETQKEQEHTNWHKNVGNVLTHEQNTNEHGIRGHQEDILPYYVYHHGYPHEEKFYKNEPVHYHDYHHHHHHLKKNEKGNPWKKVFHVLTALVPLGLILATLTPNVISINSTATTKTTRQRSEDSSPFRFKEEDVIKLMKKYGVESMNEAQCEDRIICELAVEGGKNMTGPIEKGFWFLANKTPWDVAEEAGMSELFTAIKTGNCEIYKCQKSSLKSSLGKKLIRKHKITD